MRGRGPADPSSLCENRRAARFQGEHRSESNDKEEICCELFHKSFYICRDDPQILYFESVTYKSLSKVIFKLVSLVRCMRIVVCVSLERCMLYVTCCNAVCRILYVLPYVVYSILYVVYCTRYAVCCMMYAVWRMLYIVYLMLYVGSMLYAVCFTMLFNVSYCNVLRRF